MTHVIYNTDLNALNDTAVEKLKEKIIQLTAEKESIVIAIPGGRSVAGIFQILASDESIPWQKIHLFFVDERMVPLESDDSNYKLAYESFIKNLEGAGTLPKENVHPFNYEEGIEKYEAELKEQGETFDIVILGVGEDGHVAALFPNHESIQNNAAYFITHDSSPKPPSDRMSASKALIQRSKTAFVLFIGEGKQDAYNNYNNESIDIENCPVKMANNIEEAYIITNLK